MDKFNGKSFKKYDALILGGGIFGLHAARIMSNKGMRAALVEQDNEMFSRASSINQARVHKGYHYPRSSDTAEKSAQYYEKFMEEFSFAINDSFRQIYAVSKEYSKVNASEYSDFCKLVGIPLKEVDSTQYFNPDMVQAAFETEEVSFDHSQIKDYLLNNVNNSSYIDLLMADYPTNIEKKGEMYEVTLKSGLNIKTPIIINATYASINQVLALANLDLFKIKYELCEVILCEVSNNLKDVGITIMDGPFFSVMPFGQKGCHSITSVAHTPHEVSYDELPNFSCQNGICSKERLPNYNLHPFRPDSAWESMQNLFFKYMKNDYDISYKESLFAVKPILFAAEGDDARPTIIKTHTTDPYFISVLSGKISTIYDLDNII